ncbi:hypothetical protein [Streptomyces sp. NPDC020330]|uniref:hypothetical protein n=1 Tax=unclassified Streptomyces TaxID=2593676 RepID=UPI00378FB59C
MKLWLTIAAVAAVSFVCKAFGPALLAGFVVVAVLGPGWTALDPTVIAGLSVVPLLLRHRAPLPVALVAAVAVTTALRIWV